MRLFINNGCQSSVIKLIRLQFATFTLKTHIGNSKETIQTECVCCNKARNSILWKTINWTVLVIMTKQLKTIDDCWELMTRGQEKDENAMRIINIIISIVFSIIHHRDEIKRKVTTSHLTPFATTEKVLKYVLIWAGIQGT